MHGIQRPFFVILFPSNKCKKKDTSIIIAIDISTPAPISFLNQPILQYSNEIRSAVLILHGEKAHSCYMGRDAYARMMKGNPKPENKELMILPGAVHTDLYDNLNVIPFEKIQAFFQTYLK